MPPIRAPHLYMEQASSTIRIYVEGPAEKVGISAFSQKGCGLATTTNEGTFGSLVNVWTNGVRTNRFGVHIGSESEQYIVAEVIFYLHLLQTYPCDVWCTRMHDSNNIYNIQIKAKHLVADASNLNSHRMQLFVCNMEAISNTLLGRAYEWHGT